MNLNDIREMDRDDPLAALKAKFDNSNNVIYLDGNSLGRMPISVLESTETLLKQQWSRDLITSWNKHHWIDLPTVVGDKIGRLIGASTGQVICSDSISINLFKVLAASLSQQQGRSIVLSTKDNFPTDLYMVQGLTSLLGEQNCNLKLVDETALEENLSSDVAVLMVTEVNFRTGARLDIERLTRLAHDTGVLVIVDLAHSAGAVPVSLDDWQVDFAVGCTYKYLNGGPGAPAFTYVAKRHQPHIQQPLFGWMGHASPFAFDPIYQGSADIRQQLVGTPPILAMQAVNSALDVFDDVDIHAIRAKSIALSELFLALLTQSEYAQNLKCISPANALARGSQLSFDYQQSYALCQALIDRGVVADYRDPSYIRFGFAPLYNSFEDVYLAVSEIIAILKSDYHLQDRFTVRQKVT